MFTTTQRVPLYTRKGGISYKLEKGEVVTVYYDNIRGDFGGLGELKILLPTQMERFGEYESDA